MADSFVQVAPDAGGKQIDSQAITNAAGQTVYRQTIVVADPVNLASMMGVDVSGAVQNLGQWDRFNAFIHAQNGQLIATEQQYGPGNGFLPMEQPSFLVGV